MKKKFSFYIVRKNFHSKNMNKIVGEGDLILPSIISTMLVCENTDI